MKFWIRGRRLWLARKPLNVNRYDWSNPMTVVVHHTADRGPTKANRVWSEAAFMRSTQAFHTGPSRGWSDIAYNYIIMPSGRVWEGRGYGVVGAHAPNYNRRGIGVCFAGNYSETPPTPAAIEAYYALLSRLRTHGADIDDIVAHGDVYATSCPGNALRHALNLD